MDRTVIDNAVLADIKKYIKEHLILQKENTGMICGHAPAEAIASARPAVVYDPEDAPPLQSVNEDETVLYPEETMLSGPSACASNEAKADGRQRKHRFSFAHAVKAGADAEAPKQKDASEPRLCSPSQSEARLPRKDEFRTIFDNMGTSFARALREEIDSRNLKDSQIYRKAQLSRAAYNKIITDQASPRKTSAAALLLALELDTARAEELLSKAGLSLADNNEFDLIIRYCFEHSIYDIDSINDILYEFDQPLLGSAVK